MKKYLVILLGIFLISFVSAVPSPHAFYGNVNYSNGKVVNGGIIIAEINDIEVGRGEIVNGNYDLTAQSEYGGMIYFYFNGADEPIVDYTFKAFEVTELNFIIDASEDEDKDKDNNNEDDENEIRLLKYPCEPSWQCGGWSSCNEGIKTRSCYDANYCENSYNKPNEVAGCEISEKVFVEDNYFPVMIFLGVLSIVALIVLIAVLAKE